MPTTGELVTITEAAQRLGVHEATINRYLNDGRLSRYRLGPRLVRISVAELDALVAKAAS